MIKKVLILHFLLLCALFGASVGKVSMLKGEASIIRDASNLKAKIKMPFLNNDSIQTKEKTKIQLTFKDKTVVTLGSTTKFSIEEYLYDDKNSKINLNVQSGSFKVITGKIGKLAPKSFLLKTKTSLIGIRGTIFAGKVGGEYGDYIGCIKGSIVVTSLKTQQSVMLKQTEAILISKDGFLNKIEELSDKNFISLSHLEDSFLYKNINSAPKEKIKKDEFGIYTVKANKKDRQDIDKNTLANKEPIDRLQTLVDKNVVANYSGKLEGLSKGSYQTPCCNTELQANIKADLDLKIDFGGNSPLEAKISNQKLNIISSKVDGVPKDVSLPLNQNFASNIKMQQTIDIQNSKISGNYEKTNNGFSSKATLEGTFSKDTTTLNGTLKQSTKGSLNQISIDRTIDANFNVKKQ